MAASFSANFSGLAASWAGVTCRRGKWRQHVTYMWVREVVDQRAHAVFVPFVTWSTNPQYLTFPWRTSWKRCQLLGTETIYQLHSARLGATSSAFATRVLDMVVLYEISMLFLYLESFLGVGPPKFKTKIMLLSDQSVCNLYMTQVTGHMT